MKPKISRRTTRAELAAIVKRALGTLGDDPVLVGGAVVSIYTEGRYVSNDLDMVSWRPESTYAPALVARGFEKRGSYWVHPGTEYVVQFVSPPVTVGNKHVRTPDRMRTAFGDFAILSPLDCTLDRLAWYIETGDAASLEQAIDVARAQSVPLDDIEAWLDDQKDWPGPVRRQALDRLVRRLRS